MTERAPIPGVRLRRLAVHGDERGHLIEIFRAGVVDGDDFVQSNHSRSRAGTLRGLHYHIRQSDLWYLVRGKVQVGLVDLRRHSSPPITQMLVLDDAQPSALYIPPLVAHGYLALDDADLIYFFTRQYHRDDEFGIAWNDPLLDLDWYAREPVLSERDRSNPPLRWEDLPPASR